MRCSVYIAASLDGYIARPDGALDWLSCVERPGVDYGYASFMASVDTLIIGRATYDLALGFEPWPYAGKRCVVLSHGARTPRHGEELYAGSVRELCARLEREGRKHAYVDGGQVIAQFLREGLVDELTLSIIPVLLGNGIRLFGALDRDVPLQLCDTQAFESGLVQLKYRASGG